jgi:LCP family protein required for cell wall assembly
MPDEPYGTSRGRPKSSDEQRRALANEQRLLELGNEVDQRSGTPRNRRQRHRESRRGRIVAISAIVVVVIVAGVLGGGYLYARYRFSQIPRVKDPSLTYPVSGQPFNILTVGSDSRVGLSAKAAQEVGAGTVSGQRSDVVKIMHVDPSKGTIAILSIPRDTAVTLLANQALYGKFNRINVNYGSGPSLLTQTIVANFGIPINHVIQVSFGGMLNAAESIGGVYLDFPYNAHDVMSALVVNHPGCQLVNGFQALAVARSRHYLYSPTNRPWPKDGAALYHHGDLSTLAADGWLRAHNPPERFFARDVRSREGEPRRPFQDQQLSREPAHGCGHRLDLHLQRDYWACAEVPQLQHRDNADLHPADLSGVTGVGRRALRSRASGRAVADSDIWLVTAPSYQTSSDAFGCHSNAPSDPGHHYDGGAHDHHNHGIDNNVEAQVDHHIHPPGDDDHKPEPGGCLLRPRALRSQVGLVACSLERMVGHFWPR